jgi:iron(III) transport system substrate-binding protein
MLKRLLSIGCVLSVAALIAQAAIPEARAASDQVVLYTSMPKALIEKLIDAFNKKHPDIKVELFRSGSGAVLNRLQGEFAAGVVKADLAMLADEVSMEALKHDNRLQAYKDAPVKALPKDSYDPDMTYFGTKVIAVGIIYNTKKAKKKPTSWSDLKDDAIAKSLVMPSPLYSGAQLAALTLLTEMKGVGWDMFEKLSKSGVQTVRANGEVRTAVADGSKTYGMVLDYMAIDAKLKGSPVDFIYPKEGAPAFHQPIAILKGAKRADSAKTFINYVLSRDGQEMTAKIGYRPLLPDLAPPKGFPPASEIKLLPVNAPTVAKTKATKKRFDALFGG